MQKNRNVACFPKWALNSFSISDELNFKQIGENGLKRTLFLVYRKSDENKKYINGFVSNFIDQFSIVQLYCFNLQQQNKSIAT
jgi:LysR family transcriptional regulator for metE and metH